MNKKTTGIYMRNYKVSGFKGISKPLSLDLEPNKSREFLDNVEFWGLERGKYDFGVLKSHILLGENGAGKSSLLESMMGLNLYMMKPQVFFGSFFEKHKHLTQKDGMKWDVEYVTMEKDAVTKYFLEIHIDTNGIIKKESLEFVTTKDGQTTSKRKNIYTVFNNSLVSVNGTKNNRSSDKDILNSILVKPLNGYYMYKTRKEFLELSFKKIKWGDENLNFLTNAFMAGILKQRADGEEYSIMGTNTSGSDLINKQILGIYQLFDENIKGIEMNPKTNEPIVSYKIGDEILLLDIEKTFAVISTGTKRVFLMIDMIIRATRYPIFSFFDEIDMSLHQTLTKFIIDLVASNSQGQSFFSGHDLSMTELPFRTDQIHLLVKNGVKIKEINGSEIAETKNHKFKTRYLAEKYLSNPKAKMREKVFELFDE